MINNEYYFCVDYILPYIDFTQEEIQQLYKKITGTDYVNDDNSTYIDLTLSLKLILKNLPFLNKIYITCKDVQKLPDSTEQLINELKGKIVRVNESEFMPDNYISFSPGCIEMFIWKIPGLSEHFIYSNDDMFICKEMNVNNFFSTNINNTPIMEYHNHSYNYCCLYDLWGANVNNLIYNKIKNNDNYQDRKVSLHSLRPLLKSICKQCFDKYKDFIMNSLTHIRFFNNFYIDLFTIYGLKNNLVENKINYTFKYIVANNKDITNMINMTYEELPSVLCCNDAIESTEHINELADTLNIFLNKLLKDGYK